MIRYFKTLLATLQSIDRQLAGMTVDTAAINTHLLKLSSCVQHNHHGYGDQNSLSTKPWSD